MEKERNKKGKTLENKAEKQRETKLKQRSKVENK